MKKLLILFLSFMPAIASADYLDDKIIALTKQKQEKVAILEKCQKAKGGLMAAGIATLGVSVIGIGVNIGEAVKIKDLDKDIEAVKKDNLALDAQLTIISDQIASDNSCGGNNCVGDGESMVGALNANAPICINDIWRARVCKEGYSGAYKSCKRNGVLESYVDFCSKITKPENVKVEDLGGGNYVIKIVVEGQVIEKKIQLEEGIDKISTVSGTPVNVSNNQPITVSNDQPITVNNNQPINVTNNLPEIVINNNITIPEGQQSQQDQLAVTGKDGNTYYITIENLNIFGGQGDFVPGIPGGNGFITISGEGFSTNFSYSDAGGITCPTDSNIPVTKGYTKTMTVSGASVEVVGVSSANKDIVSVSYSADSFTVKGEAAGTSPVSVTVEFKIGNKSYTCTFDVTVSEGSSGSITISGEGPSMSFSYSDAGGITCPTDKNISVTKGGTKTMTVSGVIVAGVSSTNPAIVSVSHSTNSFTVKGEAAGTSPVSVTVEFKIGNKIYPCTFDVTVSEGGGGSIVISGGGSSDLKVSERGDGPDEQAEEELTELSPSIDGSVIQNTRCGDTILVENNQTKTLCFSDEQYTFADAYRSDPFQPLVDLIVDKENKCFKVTMNPADEVNGRRYKETIKASFTMDGSTRKYVCSFIFERNGTGSSVINNTGVKIKYCNEKYISIQNMLAENFDGIGIYKGDDNIECGKAEYLHVFGINADGSLQIDTNEPCKKTGLAGAFNFKYRNNKPKTKLKKSSNAIKNYDLVAVVIHNEGYEKKFLEHCKVYCEKHKSYNIYGSNENCVLKDYGISYNDICFCNPKDTRTIKRESY